MGLADNVRLLAGIFSASDRKLLKLALAAHHQRPVAYCPCCGNRSKFDAMAPNVRFNARCPACGSLERHRLLALAMQRGFVNMAGRHVLHFAPDQIIVDLVGKQQPASNETADLEPGRANQILNIEAIALPDESLDFIVCSHVLEHVDDQRALGEMHRVLRKGGQIALMLPVIEAWTTTYEDAAIVTPEDRERHFGQWDHVRWFGADVRDRIKAQRFDCKEFFANGVDAANCNLIRGETLFLATK